MDNIILDLSAEDQVVNQRDRSSYLSWVGTVIIAIVLMALIFFINWSNPRTLLSFHGFIHTAIANQFSNGFRSTFPPEDPFFAGNPLPYYWFFQFLGAQLALVLGWNSLVAMKVIILAFTGGLIITGSYLGYKLFNNRSAGIMIGFLIIAGTNPLGFIFAGFKVVRQGTQVLVDNPDVLWGVVHPIYTLIRYNDIGGLYGPLLNFFLNLTSRPIALATLLLLILCLVRALTKWGWLSFALIIIISALLTAFSPIIGISAGATISLALLGGQLIFNHSYLVNHRRQWPFEVDHWKLSAGILAGIILAFPTYYQFIIGPSDSHFVFWLFSKAGLKHAITVTLSISPLVILAFVGIINSPWKTKLFIGTLCLAASMLLAATVMFQLPSWNQSNFFHAAVVLLAVPAGAAILQYKDSAPTIRWKWAVFLIVLFLPTNILLISSYLDRPDIPLDISDRQLTLTQHETDLANLYEWAQTKTSPDAVFVLDPRQRTAVGGNAPEFPALAHRSMFTDSLDNYLVSPFPEAPHRFDTAVKLVSGNMLEPVDEILLDNLNRPIYIVSSHEPASELINRMTVLYGQPVFNQGGYFVFRWPG